MGGTLASGVPGTSSNVPTAKQTKPANASTTQAPGQSSKTQSAQYGVDRTVTRTVTPAGRIQRITAAILVDDAMVKTNRGGKPVYERKPRTAEELAKIRDLAQAAIGFDANRGDVLNVQDMAFNGNAADADLPPATLATKIQKTVTDYSSILRPVSLLLLFLLAYIFVLRPIQKHALAPSALGSGMQPALAGANHQALPGASEPIDSNIRAAQLKQQTVEMVRQNPTDSARALRAWVREEQ
jgi:flagellar M-ring protein FliF